jgi:hypothetical protein
MNRTGDGVPKTIVFGTLAVLFIEFLGTRGHHRDGCLLRSLRLFLLLLCYIFGAAVETGFDATAALSGT